MSGFMVLGGISVDHDSFGEGGNSYFFLFNTTRGVVWAFGNYV